MAADSQRFCPVCEVTMEAAICPTDSVPTVPLDALARSERDQALGKVFAGRFQIESVLGEGGMGRVYRATQLSIGREVALKTLSASLITDRSHMRRFYLEARSASTLTSPHVVRIYDFGIDEASGAPFIAMELLVGQELRQLLRKQKTLSIRRTVRILGQVTMALREAEGARIVHRDLKPENVFLINPTGDSEFTKVMDFGIAKAIRSDTESGASALTATGTTLGTPTYMAPEHVMGEKLDSRADLYAIGCMMFEMLVGRPPFQAAETMDVLVRHLSAPAPPLPEVLPNGETPSDALCTLYKSLVQKSRDRRPASAKLVYEALEAIARGVSAPEGPEDDPGATRKHPQPIVVEPHASEPPQWEPIVIAPVASQPVEQATVPDAVHTTGPTRQVATPPHEPRAPTRPAATWLRVGLAMAALLAVVAWVAWPPETPSEAPVRTRAPAAQPVSPDRSSKAPEPAAIAQPSATSRRPDPPKQHVILLVAHPSAHVAINGVAKGTTPYRLTRRLGEPPSVLTLTAADHEPAELRLTDADAAGTRDIFLVRRSAPPPSPPPEEPDSKPAAPEPAVAKPAPRPSRATPEEATTVVKPKSKRPAKVHLEPW